MTAAQQVSPTTIDLRTGIAGPLRALCFGTLGALTARQVDNDPVVLLGGAVAGVLFQWIGLSLLALILWAANPGARHQYGSRGVGTAITRGFLLLFPFTALALAAELALGWNAVQAFASAGIMSSGAATGAELGKLGGGRLRSMLLPTGWCFVLTITWMVAGSMAVMLVKSMR